MREKDGEHGQLGARPSRRTHPQRARAVMREAETSAGCFSQWRAAGQVRPPYGLMQLSVTALVRLLERFIEDR